MTRRQIVAGSGSYQKTTLENGLRVVTEQIPAVRSIALGIWIDIGSRNETPREAGVSHLIEHAVFKGTRNRTAKEIAASLESLGGSLNAFTSKEQTCYAARVLDEHLGIAINVLADLVCNPKLTPASIGLEKHVVCEEIKESTDTPSDHIHDLFATAYWGTHPLGRPILGELNSLTDLRRPVIIEYRERNYRTGSIVIAAAGAISHRQLVKLVREMFRFSRGTAEPFVPAYRSRPRNLVFKASRSRQIHLCLGHPGFKYAAKEKLTAMVAQTYLGGGMSSVLFQKIREEKGLAYTIYTFNEFFRDAGVMATYLAADKKNLKPCLDITIKELNRLKKTRLASRSLHQAKAQLKGQLTLSMESTFSRMNRLARMELMIGSFSPLKRTLRAIDSVNSSDVLEVANRIFDHTQVALAVLGAGDKKIVEDVL